MAKIQMTMTEHGLVPFGEEAEAWFNKQPIGSAMHGTITKIRNPRFHRKFFAMLNVAFKNYEWPKVETNYGRVTVSFDLFRDFVICKAGHYEAALTPLGEVRVRPKSIAWDQMDEDEFQKLYSDVLDHILMNYLDRWTGHDMEAAIQRMYGFI